MTVRLRHFAAFLYALILLVLAVATVIEASAGTTQAHRLVYSSPWFIALWILLALSLLLMLVRLRARLTATVALLHISILLILGGALLSFLTSTHSTIHLRQGVPTTQAILSDRGQSLTLPFALRLDTFIVSHYAGTGMPRDFESRLTLIPTDGSPTHLRVSMNNIARVRLYRLYQSSFDADLRGSVLICISDPLGIPVAYSGFLLLCVTLFARLFVPRAPFRRLLSRLRHPAVACSVLLLLLSPAPLGAEQVPTVSGERAERLARQQVVYNGRIAPFNTVATDFCEKIYGKPSYRGLSAEQVLAGWILRPEVWAEQPMIRLKNASLRRRLGIEGNYASLSQFFDTEGRYRISALDSESRRADEQVGVIIMALQGSLFSSVPEGTELLTPERVTAEILHNRLRLPSRLAMICLTLGFASLYLVVARPRRILSLGAACLMALCLLLLTFYIALRWYIKGSAPLSNGYETMLLTAWAVLALSTLGCVVLRGYVRRFCLMAGFIVSGFFLLVSHISSMDPAITPLMPVLNSPLLSFHVSLVMMAYAFLSLNFTCSLMGLWLPRRRGELSLLATVLLQPAMALLAAGVCLGAVWAGLSWGSYWSWDPKETWALITLMVYAVALHPGAIKSERGRCLYQALSFLTLLMTYFGVNYLLGGLHSYA